MQQNPDLIITRLDEQKAHQQVDINKSPFSPSVYAGSGLAWAYGFPSSITAKCSGDCQAATRLSIYDKLQSYLVAEAKELQHEKRLLREQKAAEVIFRVASAYIDAENAARERTRPNRRTPSCCA